MRDDDWAAVKEAAIRLMLARKKGAEEAVKVDRLNHCLEVLAPSRRYWAYPGWRRFEALERLLEAGDFAAVVEEATEISAGLNSQSYRKRDDRHYFEVLIVDDLDPDEQDDLRSRLAEHRDPKDEFLYELVFVTGEAQAMAAIECNYTLQACVLCHGYEGDSPESMGAIIRLGGRIREFRPELDCYMLTDAPIDEVAGRAGKDFRRVFYKQEGVLDLHLSILKGIQVRYETPFFTALVRYSRKPTGVFHALPISRANSILKSHWVGDMKEFYGLNIFLAETSSTAGGLDSLLQPHGPLKVAQEKARRAFGSRKTFFVTNGTSTANKIVMQALVRPGDIVLVSRDCHKSHHYALLLAGAMPLYMDPYPLPEYSIYGAVTLKEIKRQLMVLKDAGKLDRVRMLLLTNCTFDGLVYDPLRVMEEVLAIKPDMIFLWDEAWFAFARFNPVDRKRTAMYGAKVLRERTRDDDSIRVRVYATQSTHKTLTALRQGSMIHINDQDFEQLVSEPFHEAYMTHTSTSPNYQILASLDVGRRQVELEGYELVGKSIDLAEAVRQRIEAQPLLRKYFRVLTAEDLIPNEYRLDGEFVMHPSRITMHVGLTGMDGDTFRHKLIEEHDIQVNKTSRNTVLFMTNIGTLRGSVAYLVDVLTRIAAELDQDREEQDEIADRIQDGRVHSLTKELPPLPDFSAFHERFLSSPDAVTAEGDLRSAFYLSYDDKACEYLRLDGSIEAEMASNRQVVSATFVIPYPPGFPVLVPGQVISEGILAFLKAVDVKEIHGYNPDYGLRVFKEESLACPSP